MVKKFFFKDGYALPRRLFKRDLLDLYVPSRPLRVVVNPENGLYSCSLRGRFGDVLIMCSSADKLISVVRDCYRETVSAKFLNNDFYKSLTYIFVNV